MGWPQHNFKKIVICAELLTLARTYFEQNDWLATRGARGDSILPRTHWGSWWCDTPRVLATARSKPTPILTISFKRKGVQGEAAKKLKGWAWVFFATASFIQVPFHTPFNREYSTSLVSSLWRPETLRVDVFVVLLEYAHTPAPPHSSLTG
jgi:hypothetical protein